MEFGPIEMVVIGFPKSHKFGGEIFTALKGLVEKKIIKIIDILLVKKNSAGELNVLELSDLDDADHKAFDPLISELTGLLTIDDARKLASSMPEDSSAGVMLFENSWAKDLTNTISSTGGQLVFNERIPRKVIEEMTETATE